jgi:hypothetical protein
MSFQKPRCVGIDREGAGRGASALPLIFSMEQAALSAGSAADGHNWPAMLAKHACMIIAYVNRKVTSLAARAVLLLVVLLSSCATSTAGSSPMDASASLPVEDLPPNREMMTADQQSKLKKELLDARDRQAASVKAGGGAAHAKPMERKAVQPTHQAVQQ